MRFNLYVGSNRVAEFTVDESADEPITVTLESDEDGQSIVGIDVKGPTHVAIGHWPNAEEWEVLAVLDPEDLHDESEYDHSRAKEDARNAYLDDVDLSESSTGVRLTRSQINAWAGYELDGDQLDRLEEAIPGSSIPEAVSTIAEQFRDETVGEDGEFLPRGRCDTCGAPCDEQGCTTDRSHKVAVDITKEDFA